MENEADGSYSASSSQSGEIVQGELKVDATLKYNHTVTVQTKEAKIETVDYSYSSGRYKDRLDGIMLRVFDAGGEQVAEFKNTEAAKRRWPGEEKGGEGKVIIR